MDPDLHRVHAEMDETHWWFRARRRVIASTLDRYVPQIDGAVLDVGCGAGGLLDTLATHGAVVAIEGEKATADVAAQRHPDADVRVGSLPEGIVDIPGCRLATAFDVIEHVDDDVGLLRAMATQLLPGGIVCVTVPALPFLWSSHDDANGHRRRYVVRTLRASLEAASLEVVHISYFNTFLLPAVAAARVLERVRGPADHDDFHLSLGPVDRLLEAVFALERHLVPRWRLPIGVSLIAVARAT